MSFIGAIHPDRLQVGSRPQVEPHGLPILGMAPTLRRDPLGYLTRLPREYGEVAWFKLDFDQVVRKMTAWVFDQLLGPAL